MTKIKYTLMGAGMISAFFILFAFTTLTTKDIVPVGTVIYSVMPPEYFLSENPDWIMVDGRKLDDNSKLSLMLGTYSKKNMDSIPDLLGMFLRTANYKNRGSDVDSLRIIGSVQLDATKLPNRTISGQGKTKLDLGSHSHTLNGGTISKKIGYVPALNPDIIFGERGNRNGKFNGTTSKDGNHQHNVEIIIDQGGDLETRPKNVALYTYIKIN
ncbi:hypothetical protein V2598_06435 [Tenacibaculum maritimum]|uniref:hypothetical protein n=1 Tax=Tenacibaculum maritimum TaxID=107401 RepID=UPI00387618CD